MPKPGQPAPAFSLPSTAGRDVSLRELRGRRVVLYFYPRDDTPGCTREACGFRDAITRVRAAGAIVLGVSKDGLAAHARFREKYDLPFDLLVDADNAVAKAYGAYGPKKMYGKDVLGTIRSTFLVDEKGDIERAWSPVRVDGHVDQVLEALSGGSTADARARRTTTTRPGKAVKPTRGREQRAPSRVSTAARPATSGAKPSRSSPSKRRANASSTTKTRARSS